MQKTILSLLRNKHSSMESFRQAADQMGTLLAYQAAELLEKEEHSVETPLAVARGEHLKHSIVLLPILRAGLALLTPFMRLFTNSKVGFVGIRRDEKTALPHLYYQNLPPISPNEIVVILDPMIATGGSGGVVLDLLKQLEIPDERILYVGVIAAPEGVAFLQQKAPHMRILSAEVDERLNDQKFILPGLGDFGDRYFGT